MNGRAREYAGSPKTHGVRGQTGAGHGAREVRADEAARQRRDDWSRRPRQDDAHGGDDEGAGAARRSRVPGVRLDRQRPGREGARDHDRDRPRRVRDRRPPLRTRRLPRARRLHQEHDHRRRADGRRDPRRGGARRPDAADARAPAAGAPGRGPGGGGVPQQGRHDGRRGVARAGRARDAGPAHHLRVPRRRRADHPRLGATRARVDLGGPRRARVRVHLAAHGGGRQLHPAAGAPRRTSRS